MKRSKVIDKDPSLFPEWDEDLDKKAAPALETLQPEVYNHKALFERLAQSAFRSKFKLSLRIKPIYKRKALATIRIMR